MKFTKDWTTHQTMLIKCVEKTDKPVLELGSGLFSTPLLHWICKMQGVNLLTYENEEEYYNFARGFRSRMHRIRLIKNWDELDLNTHWGVIFIDHHPALQRGKDVIKFKDNADYLILHDTEKEEIYGYDKVWQHFKYRYDWKDCPPYTTVLSNFKDLSDLGEKLKKIETKESPEIKEVYSEEIVLEPKEKKEVEKNKKSTIKIKKKSKIYKNKKVVKK